MNEVRQCVGELKCIQKILEGWNEEEFWWDIENCVLWLESCRNNPRDWKEEDDGGDPTSDGQRYFGCLLVTRLHDDFSAHADSSAFLRAFRT